MTFIKLKKVIPSFIILLSFFACSNNNARIPAEVQLPSFSEIITIEAKTALIFNGAGTCGGCPEAIANLLKEKKYKVNYVNESNLNREILSKAELYVQPGGSDDITETISALTSDQIKAIKDYVQSGGVYLGVCAGAYLAGKYSDEKLNFPGFDLIELSEVDQETENDDQAKLIKIILPSNNVRFTYYQAGPHFGFNIPINAKIMSYYSNTKHIASRISFLGKGKVGLIGPHYEADKSWYREDNLSTKYGFNFDLFNQFIDEISK
jgi:glutamine amidotransferase-like uncharacterized protein